LAILEETALLPWPLAVLYVAPSLRFQRGADLESVSEKGCPTETGCPKASLVVVRDDENKTSTTDGSLPSSAFSNPRRENPSGFPFFLRIRCTLTKEDGMLP